MTVIVSGTLITKSGGLAFTGLNDTPISYTGEAGKVVAVNGTEDGLEFIAGGGGGAVDSVFSRTGAVVAADGDYSIGQMSDVDITTVAPTTTQVLAWDGSNFVPANAGGGSATALEPFRSNTTITVGTVGGEDYATLEEAIDYVMSRNIASDQTGSGNTPKVVLQLSAGTFNTVGALKIDNLNLSLELTGAGSTSTFIQEDLKFRNCPDVKIDSMDIQGLVQNSGCGIICSWSDFDMVLSGGVYQSYRNSNTGFRGPVTVKYLFIETGLFYTWDTVDFVTGDYARAISAGNGAQISFDGVDVTFDLTGRTSTDPLIFAYNQGSITLGGNVTSSNGATHTSMFNATTGGQITVGGTITKGTATNVAPYPVGQIQADGAAIYDGTTESSTTEEFTGAGSTGGVPDPGTAVGNFLKDDGTWAVVPTPVIPGSGIITYTVPGDYATVDAAVTAAQTSGAQKVILQITGTQTLASDIQWFDDNWPDLEFVGGTLIGDSTVQNIWFYNANSKILFNSISLRNISLAVDNACECVMYNVTLLSGGANFTYPEVYLNNSAKMIITNMSGRFSQVILNGAATLIASDNFDLDTVDQAGTVMSMSGASRAIISGSIGITSTTNTSGNVITCGDESSLQCSGITAVGQTGGTILTVTEIATATAGTITPGTATASSPAGTAKSPTVFI